MSEEKKEAYSVEDAFIELKNEAYLKGIHLMDRPFLPEEIGFVETPIRNANDSVIAIVYSKEGFNISLPVVGEKKIWTIITPEDTTVKAEINSLFEGLLILSALGVSECHPFDYVKKSLQESLEI